MQSLTLDERKRRERDFHNTIFDDHRRQAVGKFYAVTTRSQDTFARAVIERSVGKRVLVYGCGEGSMAFGLPEAKSVTGIDISDVAIDRLSAKAGRSEKHQFFVMDAENLDFPDAAFDLVCGSGILHHLKIDRAYSEISRVLKPDGAAVFFEPLGHNPLINFYRRMTPTMRTADEHPLLISDLHRAGKYFASVNMQFFHLLSLGALGLRSSKYFRQALRLTDDADAALFRSIPWLRRFAWISILTLEKPGRQN